MKDFRSIIGGDAESVKNLRVQTCIDSVCDESKMEIMNMRKQFRNLQMQRENLLDLGQLLPLILQPMLKTLTHKN